MNSWLLPPYWLIKCCKIPLWRLLQITLHLSTDERFLFYLRLYLPNGIAFSEFKSLYEFPVVYLLYWFEHGQDRIFLWFNSTSFISRCVFKHDKPLDLCNLVTYFVFFVAVALSLLLADSFLHSVK